MNRRNVLFVLSALAFLVSAMAPVLAQQQVTPPSPILVNSPIVTINNSAGNQTDPHVRGDLVSYTDLADGSVHCHNH